MYVSSSECGDNYGPRAVIQSLRSIALAHALVEGTSIAHAQYEIYMLGILYNHLMYGVVKGEIKS